MAIVVGIVLAYLSNYCIGQLALGVDVWRWKLGIAAVPALAILGLLLLVPESARWLAARGRMAEAVAAHRALLGEMEVLPEVQRDADERDMIDWRRFLREAKRPIALAVMLAAFNQLTGINAILYYANDIFAAVGFGQVAADVQSIAIGVTNRAFTLIAMTVIDRVGRRRMLLAGSVGMVAMLGVAAAVMFGVFPQSWLLAVLILFIASFAVSQGAVIWVYISEIFPTRFRAAGQGVGSGTIWLADALVAQFYPIVAAQSKGAPFLFFMVAMIAQGVIVLLFFPETKGVSLEDLETRMGTAA